MASRISQIPGDLPFYVLECDNCHTPYGCFDSTGYDWDAVLRSARDTGWITKPTHQCPRCAADDHSSLAA
jgi:hypothetical protein